MIPRRQCILALSGGMDSTALLFHCIARYGASNVHVVNFSYGSKHNSWEAEAARNVIAPLSLGSKRSIDLTSALVEAQLKSNLLKSGGAIPEGHYTDSSMSLTVVPGRNTIFASIMLGIAQGLNEGAGADLALGIHAGDHAIYPDCRPEWAAAFKQVAEAASDGAVGLWTPFLSVSKGGIIRLSRLGNIDVPWHLTRTCYKDQKIACGKCGSCVERLEAFADNEMADPIEYENDID